MTTFIVSAPSEIEAFRARVNGWFGFPDGLGTIDYKLPITNVTGDKGGYPRDWIIQYITLGAPNPFGEEGDFTAPNPIAMPDPYEFIELDGTEPDWFARGQSGY